MSAQLILLPQKFLNLKKIITFVKNKKYDIKNQ